MDPLNWPRPELPIRCEYFDGGVTDMPPGFTTNWRSLPWLVTSQVLGGSQILELDDGQVWEILPGEAVCVSSGLRHLFENRQVGTNVSKWSHIILCIGEGVNAASVLDLTLRLTGPEADRLGCINAELANATDESSGLTAMLAAMAKRRSVEMELVSLIFQAAPSSKLRSFWRELERLTPVLSFIEANLDKPIRREELAKLAHLSPSRFANVFKAALGMAPGEYVLQLQLRQAQTQLITTDMPVAYIADRCGHPDPFHFSRVFKKYVGVSPAYYRERMKIGGP